MLSVEYRLGPEHRFPRAHEDGFAAFAWAQRSAPRSSASIRRASRSAATAPAAGSPRRSARSPSRAGSAPPAYQFLIYPAVDARGPTIRRAATSIAACRSRARRSRGSRRATRPRGGRRLAGCSRRCSRRRWRTHAADVSARCWFRPAARRGAGIRGTAARSGRARSLRSAPGALRMPSSTLRASCRTPAGPCETESTQPLPCCTPDGIGSNRRLAANGAAVKTLSGGVAVVTGAASGIGRALALALAREGMTLALADRDEKGLARDRAARRARRRRGVGARGRREPTKPR